MPLYEYVCKSCSHPFEEIAGVDELAPCPKCSTNETERVLFSRTAVLSSDSGPAASPCGGCPNARAGGCSVN